MNIYFPLGIFIGILLGIIIEKYVFSYFDILYEKFTYKQTITCTKYKVESQTLAKEFELKYGELQELPPAIGFKIQSSNVECDEDCDDDGCECEDIKKNKIGFRV